MKEMRKSGGKKIWGLTLCLIMTAAAVGCGTEERENTEREGLVPQGYKSTGRSGVSGEGQDTAESVASGEIHGTVKADSSEVSAEDPGSLGGNEAGAVAAGGSGTVQRTDKDIKGAMRDFGVRLLQGCFGSSQEFPPHASMPQSVYAALERESNLLVSPLSLVSALAMTANGAEGDTLKEMETVLGLSAAEMNVFLSSYMESLSDDEKCRLNMADSIWFTADERFTVEEEFLRTNKAFFGASGRPLTRRLQTFQN